jgi:hypothetical protein
MNAEISHICWHISAIKATQETEVRIQGHPSKIIKTLPKDKLRSMTMVEILFTRI